MKSKRKWLAGILSVVMTMTFMPTYAFAGEAAEGGADADAVWTVKNADGKVVGNYNEMQDAVDAFKTTVKTDEEDNTSWGKIILNHDASGSGVLLETENEDSYWFQYDFDFNGHTYTIEEGTETGPGGEETYIVGIYDRTYKEWAFQNGTLKIENSAAGIDGGSVQLNNFNVDASNATGCTEVMNLQGTVDIKGNSSVKAAPGKKALVIDKYEYLNDSVIDTKGTIEGNIAFNGEKDAEEGYHTSVLINNGTINGKFENATDEDGTVYVKLYGGVFNERPEDEYLAKGYAFEAREDGRYAVVATTPVLKHIKELREEVAEANESLNADQNTVNKKMFELRGNIESAESDLNDGIYDKGIDKATADAEKSIKEAKAQLEELKQFINQKEKEYNEKSQALKDKCATVREELNGLNTDEYDFGDFDPEYEFDSISDDVDLMKTVFGNTVDEETGDETKSSYAVELDELSGRFEKVESKLSKVRALPDTLNKETKDALEETKKELENTQNSLNKANKELEELNKKVDTLQNSLKETQDKLKKTEEQLKNQNNKPTPSPTVAPVKKPGQVKGLKLKAGKKKVTVTYKKVSGATSYKVTYSTSKKFKKAKTVTVKSGKTVKKTISKLKSKKTYYVKVRAVKKVKGKSYIGKWSAVKKVKIK